MSSTEAGIGHNQPDHAKETIDALALEYDGLAAEVAALLAEMRAEVPESVETDEQNGIIAGYMSRVRDMIKRAENHREAEKAPHLVRGRAVDGFFKTFTDRLDKARAILQARGNAYTVRKLAAERAERERKAREAAEEAARIAAEAERQRLEQQEAERAAARARKPENIEKHEDRATAIAQQVEVLQVETMVATDQAVAAQHATLAKSADIARTRYDTGHMATAKQVPYVEITDVDQLDKNQLWPFISEAEKLRALKAWARLTGHKKRMDGAIVEMRDAADYR